MGGGLLTGLRIGLSGLEVQQAVMSVTAHNVDNAGNAGYDLQEIELAPNPPYSPPALHRAQGAGQFGTGVTVAAVVREVSRFLQLQGWATASQLASGQQQTQALSQAQALFDEPSANGLGAALSTFWQSWQGLANHPQSEAARSQVVADGQALASTFNALSQGLGTLQRDLDATVAQDVAQVNQLASRIAALNAQIGAASANGQNPNDLEDTRDQLVGQLAQLMPVTVSWSADGEVTVASGGVDVVSGRQTTQLIATPDPTNQNFHSLTWSAGMPAQLGGGQLGALLALRDQTLPGYLGQLDALASAVAAQVNAQHAQGSDASGAPVNGKPQQNFFTVPAGGVTAANLGVNPVLVANPDLLAAAATPSGGAGDGSNALQIAQLQERAFVPTAGNPATPGDAYAALIGRAGSDLSAAQSDTANQQVLQQSIQSQQQQTSGVSLDEEMVQMVQAHNAYAAAAKVISTIDAMLSDLVSMVPAT